MISVKATARFFGLNHRLIHMQIGGFTHEDSVLQLPFRGNCLNWVLGHIVVNRNVALTILGEGTAWSDEESVRYATDSDPIAGARDALRLERIVSDLDRAQERLDAAFRNVSPERWEARAGEQTVGERLAGLLWHETYHTGQTEYLRQLAGKDDAVV